MELLLCVVIGEHIFIFSNEAVVVCLEVFYEKEFMVLPRQQSNEVSFHLGYVLPLVQLLILQADKSTVETADCGGFYFVPQF